MAFIMAEGDLSPIVEKTLQDGAGAAIDLTGAISVTFLAEAIDPGIASIEGAAVVMNAAGGVVRYLWAAGDTAAPGLYRMRWRVVYSDSKPENFPQAGTDWLEVTPALAPA